MKILLKIRYDGTDFCGYAVQPNKRTVQGTLNQAARLLCGTECNITGCSRTDSGVHALCYYCTLEPTDGSQINIPLKNIPVALNAVLPKDLAVLDAFCVEDGFHARYDVLSKEYTYFIYNSQIKDPFFSNRALQLQKLLDRDSIEEMNKAAGYLCGTYDFKCFMAQNSSVTNTTRTVYYARFEQNGEKIIFKICADGFLYNMVRIIVGTMLEVGYKKKQPSDILRIIDSGQRKNAGQTAPPQGLYLSAVNYERSLNIH